MSQPIIKLLLLAAIALVALFALRGSTKPVHRVLWRGYVVGILVAAALSILYPDLLSRFAKLVGVGRGTDLLLYMLVVTFLFVSVILFRRLEALERKYVGLARHMAIRDSASNGQVDTPLEDEAELEPSDPDLRLHRHRATRSPFS
jgi:hypothetical protein